MSYQLFEVFGIEFEYMIVDRDTHRIRPIADLLFKECTGSFTSDYENGKIAWSNELVSHVIELKTNGPVSNMSEMVAAFHKNVKAVNGLLEKHHAVLMPGGAHPTVDPLTETQIWPHEYNEIYELYNRIFNCQGHGWSNLQSTHINLPFKGDAQFAKLHAAIRLLLPIIPALSASTPILDGRHTGFKDARLEHYRHNQKKLPVIAGKVIPEAVYTKAAYHELIFKPIIATIKPYDTDGILNHLFLNSRGAIARFDRGAIEIRVIDNQECPKADIAILNLIVAVLKAFCSRTASDQQRMQLADTDMLANHFLNVVKHAELAQIDDSNYLALLGVSTSPQSAQSLWKQLFAQHGNALPEEERKTIHYILENGSLATRMEHVFTENPNQDGISAINRKMITCLQDNDLF